MENRELMAKARESLSGKWGLAIGTFLVYGLIVGGIGVVPLAGSIAVLLIAGPMAVGLATFSLTLARKEDAKLNQIFNGFSKFGTALGANLLKMLFVFLWTLLLIIPGIIATISYSQLFYILAEDDSIGIRDAITKSKKMMYGYKWKYFCLGCRFIGWALLCIFTLGIGYLWLSPYIGISFANFYEDIKDKKIEREN